MARCLLTEDYDQTRYEVETPLTSKIDYIQVRRELGVPDYVDPKNFLLERGLVTIWAAQKPSRLKELGSSPELAKIKDDPIPVLFFGGGAVRLLSKTANDLRSPLHREIDDIDLVASRKRGKELYRLLLTMGEICGTKYYHFVTQTDRRFNAMRSGERYRLRAIDKIIGGDSLKAGTLDIFIDDIDLRHKVDVRSAFDKAKQQHYTIGLENVLLAKCQYIFDVPKTAHDDLVQHGLEYRVLDYPYFKSHMLLIGIEEKDIKDICSILLDHPVGNGPGELNIEAINSVLGKDKKFSLTFRLNFESLLRNEKILKNLGLADGSVETIMSRANEVLKAVPMVDKKWSNPWWNVDVQTPAIFGKTQT
jgi:hypothetical protein